jgi:hypothetical protein
MMLKNFLKGSDYFKRNAEIQISRKNRKNKNGGRKQSVRLGSLIGGIITILAIVIIIILCSSLVYSMFSGNNDII